MQLRNYKQRFYFFFELKTLKIIEMPLTNSFELPNVSRIQVYLLWLARHIMHGVKCLRETIGTRTMSLV